MRRAALYVGEDRLGGGGRRDVSSVEVGVGLTVRSQRTFTTVSAVAGDGGADMVSWGEERAEAQVVVFMVVNDV
jgi:hypothetical protein